MNLGVPLVDGMVDRSALEQFVDDMIEATVCRKADNVV